MKIVVINGKAGTGKDTFVTMCKDVLGSTLVFNVSTVDFVKEVATYCGWDGTKTPENRKFLSDLKDILTQWDNVPFKKVCKDIEAWQHILIAAGKCDKAVVFIHCREPKEIKKLVEELDAISLLIRRDAAESVEQMNHADNEVLNYEYDYTIPNNSSLSELRARAEEFLRGCLELKF
jgi:CO dehydrogenase nickel-insertion accessory protein CooC1